jgi:single-strand DNA-binding protein
MQEKTEWVRVVVWGKLAESCAQYLSKGRMAYVEGRLQTRTWEDQQGQKKYTTEVLAKTVLFLGDKKQGHSEDFSPDFDSDTEGPF